ncbi:Uncharacterised protein [Mycobacteroides abscessus subsp. abscessus]|nr:Uncharacterised protein [Mycobacteroides abscessus subsp. abscessus]SKS97917.1 Uncharacterised protein [Mycobacteroides abscessus subsp. abscessus]SKU98846.1 Uncharacterised protein [Mycobacteroides abscessus subsp. abscessus]
MGLNTSRMPPRTANSPRPATMSTRVYASSTKRAITPSNSSSAPTASSTGSRSNSSGDIGCSSERTVVITTRSGTPIRESSGWANRCSTCSRAPTVSTPGDNRSCGSVSQDGSSVTASPYTSRSSAVRSCASRVVAVTTKTGASLASAIPVTTNARAHVGAVRSRPVLAAIAGARTSNAGSRKAVRITPARGGVVAVMVHPFYRQPPGRLLGGLEPSRLRFLTHFASRRRQTRRVGA